MPWSQEDQTQTDDAIVVKFFDAADQTQHLVLGEVYGEKRCKALCASC